MPVGVPPRADRDGPGYYLSLQGFAPGQVAYAHTHPDREEWVVVLGGNGEARFGPTPVPLTPGVVVGRGASHPHGFVAGDEPMYLLSLQLPRPAEGATTWDEPGTTTDPAACVGRPVPAMRPLRRPQRARLPAPTSAARTAATSSDALRFRRGTPSPSSGQS